MIVEEALSRPNAREVSNGWDEAFSFGLTIAYWFYYWDREGGIRVGIIILERCNVQSVCDVAFGLQPPGSTRDLHTTPEGDMIAASSLVPSANQNLVQTP